MYEHKTKTAKNPEHEAKLKKNYNDLEKVFNKVMKAKLTNEKALKGSVEVIYYGS